MFVFEFEGKTPHIHSTVFVAQSASVIGDVIIGEGSSVWPGAVIRGDVNTITIGKYTSIQDNAVVHVTPQNLTKIGDYVTVGHGAVVHAATVENNTLIGMKAVLLDGAKINKNSIIGAGSVVLENTEFPANCLVVGIPGKIVRDLNSSKQKKDAQMHAMFYSQLAQKHKKNLEKE
ncbi:gamma carbonic anhydrase family protein [Candidatus Bathyarchaeota archaeon]|nr:gamma carbonic anhydrase family protein [Candidatus Bathyarchaeota archaeon]